MKINNLVYELIKNLPNFTRKIFFITFRNIKAKGYLLISALFSAR